MGTRHPFHVDSEMPAAKTPRLPFIIDIENIVLHNHKRAFQKRKKTHWGWWIAFKYVSDFKKKLENLSALPMLEWFAGIIFLYVGYFQISFDIDL